MRVSRLALLAVLVAPSLGCSANADVKPVAPPAELVGKWRLERQEGASARVSVYHVSPDGFVEIDTRVTTPDRKMSDWVRAAITQVEGDTLTVVDLSRVGTGDEEVIPADRRRPRTVRYRVAGDELHWGLGTETQMVLTRVKD
jgi:hypothetical protein